MKEKIIKLLENPDIISDKDIVEIENIIIKYSYFQIGQLLLTKGLLNTNSIRYNRQLKKASIYTLERTKLFQLISLKQKTEKKVVKTTKKQSIKEKLNIGKPLMFNEQEQHSFSQWLTLLQTKKIDRKSSAPTDDTLVNKFLDNKPQISRVKKNLFFKATNIAKNSLVENDDLVTPTLAKVYLEQGYYDKAIGAYNKLILKYPKKSTFFAAQIKLIHKLNNK